MPKFRARAASETALAASGIEARGPLEERHREEGIHLGLIGDFATASKLW